MLNVRPALIGLLIIALPLSGGCVTGTTGTQLQSNKVTQIRKGETTRSEVEKLFGPPLNAMPIGNGQTVMVYAGGQYHSNYGPSMVSFIPIVGGFIPAKQTDTQRRQSLQVILDHNNIVQDVQFSDNTTQTDTTLSMFGGNVQQNTTSNVPNH